MTAERALRIGLDMAEHRHLPIKKVVPFNTIPREELAQRFSTDGSDARTQAAMRCAEASLPPHKLAAYATFSQASSLCYLLTS